MPQLFFFDGLGMVWTHLNWESTPTQVGTNLSNNNLTTNKCSSCTPLEPRFFPRCAVGKTFIIEQYVPTNFMEIIHTGYCHIFFLTNHSSQNESFRTMPTKIIRLWEGRLMMFNATLILMKHWRSKCEERIRGLPKSTSYFFCWICNLNANCQNKPHSFLPKSSGILTYTATMTWTAWNLI